MGFLERLSYIHKRWIRVERDKEKRKKNILFNSFYGTARAIIQIEDFSLATSLSRFCAERAIGDEELWIPANDTTNYIHIYTYVEEKET